MITDIKILINMSQFSNLNEKMWLKDQIYQKEKEIILG